MEAGYSLENLNIFAKAPPFSPVSRSLYYELLGIHLSNIQNVLTVLVDYLLFNSNNYSINYSCTNIIDTSENDEKKVGAVIRGLYSKKDADAGSSEEKESPEATKINDNKKIIKKKKKNNNNSDDDQDTDQIPIWIDHFFVLDNRLPNIRLSLHQSNRKGYRFIVILHLISKSQLDKNINVNESKLINQWRNSYEYFCTLIKTTVSDDDKDDMINDEDDQDEDDKDDKDDENENENENDNNNDDGDDDKKEKSVVLCLEKTDIFCKTLVCYDHLSVIWSQSDFQLVGSGMQHFYAKPKSYYCNYDVNQCNFLKNEKIASKFEHFKQQYSQFLQDTDVAKPFEQCFMKLFITMNSATNRGVASIVYDTCDFNGDID